MDAPELDIIKSLHDGVAALIGERNTLRAIVAGQTQPKSDSPIARVLQDALDGKRGWRDEARQVLGVSRFLSCDFCGRLFPSGGRRRLYCGKC